MTEIDAQIASELTAAGKLEAQASAHRRAVETLKALQAKLQGVARNGKRKRDRPAVVVGNSADGTAPSLTSGKATP